MVPFVENYVIKSNTVFSSFRKNIVRNQDISFTCVGRFLNILLIIRILYLVRFVNILLIIVRFVKYDIRNNDIAFSSFHSLIKIIPQTQLSSRRDDMTGRYDN